MTNARPYRNALPEEKAINELKVFSGKQFDEKMAKAYLELLPFLKKEEATQEKEELVVAQLIKAA